MVKGGARQRVARNASFERELRDTALAVIQVVGHVAGGNRHSLVPLSSTGSRAPVTDESNRVEVKLGPTPVSSFPS